MKIVNSQINLKELQSQFVNSFDNFADDYFSKLELSGHPDFELFKSMRYSFFSGGKRFRPFLSHLVFDVINQDKSSNQRTFLSYALAVEMIHTYSLIHDDLPCMDNDDFRRGKPTNHKVHGEALALLAGDALLTQAFEVIADHYKDRPKLVSQLVLLLAKKSGSRGMIAGQIIDIKSDKETAQDFIFQMHQLKTSALIEAAIEGAALIACCDEVVLNEISKFGQSLGLAFQIKDDILDSEDKDQDFKNLVSIFGLEVSYKHLNDQSQKAKDILKKLDQINTQYLIDLVDYNLTRQV